ncbi:DUF3422 domain-containing protein [Chelatococcus sp. SYSU_G07232]|uniref:DUF3422 domain-containing protein n=1 Tax=Chelatococcus albus TaxID=3047466 RepID=A0ABT7AEW3_9HYPH|nr:DUF3422 domain-containing protein [Chelatococcus sp. SYSU_G07232]MDJ1157918.1 DUF3422 domain-containing protein [Chelatococcus sp. SYSU_G07232]
MNETNRPLTPSVASLAAHPLREAVLGEVHARPFLPVATPARLLHFAFMTDVAAAAGDRARLGALCAAHGRPGPLPEAKHHHVVLPGGALRWEQHSEFTTYTWDVGGRDRAPFERWAAGLAAPMFALSQPGPLLVAADLQLIAEAEGQALEDLFDPASLAASLVDDGAAVAATDFRVGGDGFVRLLVLDRALGPARAGALTQRLLEVETYRTLALLGLPEAQRLGPAVKAIEDALTRIAGAMTQGEGVMADARLLDELTALAARLEADAAASSYRFGAARAYDGIVQQRLVAIHEQPFGGHPTLAAFLARRMAPAMRTCLMLEERQANLSRKLTRAANLLRTRVDVAIEHQNRDLLAAMNERTRLQLRLQQTVEGLSVAAISYYVVGLAGYVLKGAKDAGAPLDPSLGTALAVPLAVLFVWLVVRRIRKHHTAE